MLDNIILNILVRGSLVFLLLCIYFPLYFVLGRLSFGVSLIKTLASFLLLLHGSLSSLAWFLSILTWYHRAWLDFGATVALFTAFAPVDPICRPGSRVCSFVFPATQFSGDPVRESIFRCGGFGNLYSASVL